MKNNIIFKNIFLNDAVTSTINDIKNNLKETKDTTFVSDNGEWDFKLNTALVSFEDFDINNFDIKQFKKVISDISDFIDLIENTTPQEKEYILLMKDFNFLKEKIRLYDSVEKENVVLKNADPVTLENLSEFVCGDNSEKYPIYRSSYYLTKFFNDIDINVEHDGTTRKWWVLSILKNLSDYDLNRVILRLVDIKIYKGNKEDWEKAVSSMNDILFCEDLKLSVKGKNIKIVSDEDDATENLRKESSAAFTNNFNESQIHLGSGKDIKNDNNKKEWYEKPLGIIVLTVFGGLIIAGVVYFLGWN